MALDHSIKVIKGVSKILIAPVAVITEATPWQEILVSIKDSVKVSQANPTKTEGLIDQQSQALYYTYADSPLTIEFSVPDVADEILSLLCNTAVPTYVPAGFTAVGVDLAVKELQKMIKIVHEDGSSIIVTNGSLVSGFNADSLSTKAGQFNVMISAMAPSAAGEPMPFIFYKKTGVVATTYTWVKYGSSAAGAGMSDVIGSLTYIGLAYNKSTAVESTNPADYVWTLM